MSENPVELTDAEIDAVVGGLNLIGFFAETNGGQFIGGVFKDEVSFAGGEVFAQQIVNFAQTSV